MDGWMDGWMDSQMIRWTDGWRTGGGRKSGHVTKDLRKASTVGLMVADAIIPTRNPGCRFFSFSSYL